MVDLSIAMLVHQRLKRVKMRGFYTETVICQLVFSPWAWDIKIAWDTEKSKMLFRQTGLLQLQKKNLANTIYEDMTVTSKATQEMTKTNVYLHKFNKNKNKHKKQDLTNKKTWKGGTQYFFGCLMDQDARNHETYQ